MGTSETMYSEQQLPSEAEEEAEIAARLSLRLFMAAFMDAAMLIAGWLIQPRLGLVHG